MRIGVLALQGDFAAHARVLARLGVAAPEIRGPWELDAIDGLIIPGGESTTIGRLLDELGLLESLRERIRAGLPLYGTCAGMIVLASEILDRATIDGRPQPGLGVMDIAVRRNAFGRQVDSFEAELPMPRLGERAVPAVFIRAPRIVRTGPTVEVLARLPDTTAVAAQQGSMLVTAFHPELTQDPRVHQYFVSLVMAVRAGAAAGP